MTRENNAIIQGRLADLLNIIDARATISIFERVGNAEPIIQSNVQVYEIIANHDFMKTYKNYDVIGLKCDLFTTIMIQKNEY